ncbi:MAG: dTMP kinase [Desulfobacteraceae bacterium]|jgi:dTMP kinase
MFITLEGIEGAGKSSQVENIAAFFERRGYSCRITREPGGTAVGAQIRGILLDPANRNMDPRTELLLYIADRIQHIKTVIEPNLGERRVVLCDRFFDATLVYQGYARGLDKELIRDLHRLVCNNLAPDLTLLFDLDPQVGLARAWRQIDSGGRTGIESRFELEALAFHEKVRCGYLELARSDPGRFRVIDAARERDDVTQAVETVLAAYLNGESL